MVQLFLLIKQCLKIEQAGKNHWMACEDNDQTEIPLVWGPKALPPYNPYVFDKTNNKIAQYFQNTQII